MPLNCTAIPAELLESELFGHVRGAFSGAQADREGKFGTADGGTLFLDEIGDMDQRLQAKLLRERAEDVPTLAAAFLAEFGRELGKGPLALGEGAAAALQHYAWPGNVRELRNLMERAAVPVAGGVVDADRVRTLLPPREAGCPEGAEEGFELAAAVAETERKAILRALAATGDSKVEAAALLGIGERTLWTKLKKHGLEPGAPW